MSEESQIESSPQQEKTVLERLNIQNGQMVLWTIIYSLLGAVLFMLIAIIDMPYTMVGLFMFGFAPALAIIAVAGAIRGPIAGLLTGYLGVLLHDFIFYGAVVTFTLPALAYGVLGFVAGLASYDFTSGRSLVKLSILSTIGMVFTTLLVVVFGMMIESYATLVALCYVMLPLLTVGIPSVLLITPIFARLCHLTLSKFMPSALT